MNKIDTDLILCAVGGLPPVAWLNLCRTSDQREYWDDVRMVYQRVYAELKTYFSGQPHPYTSPDPKLRRLYQLLSRRYIDLYSVIRDGWELIKQKADAFDIELSVDTPGEYLVLIIERDCAMSFSQCLNNGEYRPRYEYEMHKLKTKAQQLNSQGRNLTKKEEKEIIKFEKFQKQCQRTVEDNLTVWAFHLLLQEACWGSRDADICTSVRRFRQTDAELEEHLRAFAHPSKRQKGQRFVNGVKESLS
jgi:uncharacterized protein YfcZ (UPF0381/DUF406 family)